MPEEERHFPMQGKDVEYSLRAIPLGGYVAFPDDDPESKFEADDPDLLKNRSILQRAIVISAGVIANVIFAFSLLLTQVRSQVQERLFSTDRAACQALPCARSCCWFEFRACAFLFQRMRLLSRCWKIAAFTSSMQAAPG